MLDTKIEIQENEDLVFNLDSIGVEGAELIVEEGDRYILTKDGYFSLNEFNFVKEGDFWVVRNESGDSFSITEEQFNLIRDFIF